MLARRVAALAEILLVLALGNLLGEALFGLLAPAAVLEGNATELSQAFYAGLLILLRLGLAGALGLALLYWRRGITPRRAGLSRNRQPLPTLLVQGAVLGLVASFLVCVLFAVHALVPLGEGLDAWWSYADTPIDAAFWVMLLGTSIFIPPLTEEIMARGYFRLRLVESYGVMAGVVLTGLVFGLSHTRYLNGDGMLALFMGIILVNSISWTYLAQKTGSIIPPLVAHALSNGVGSAVLFNTWIQLLLTSVGMALCWRPVFATLRQFASDWAADGERHSLWQGVGIVLAILVSALLLLGQIGRTPTLLALGLFCLLVTSANLFLEKRRGRRALS